MALYVRTNKCCIVRSDLEYILLYLLFVVQSISVDISITYRKYTCDIYIYRSVDASNNDELGIRRIDF